MDYKLTLKQIKLLQKADRFAEALELTVALKKVYWNDDRLHRLINKLKIKARKQEIQQGKAFIKNGILAIQKLHNEKKFEEAIKACREVLEVDPENVKIPILLENAKIAFIDEKLADPLKSKWLAEGKYGKLYLFYQKLRKVFPQHPHLNQLIQQTGKKMKEQDRASKKAFADESLKKLKEMFAQGKYEAVIKGAEDLILYTHERVGEAHKLLETAQKENRKEIERDTIQYMKNQQPLLKAAYESKSEPMIKI